MTLSAGALDQRVQFQRKISMPDALNQPVVTWENIGPRVWASVGSISGRYSHIANQMQSQTGMQIGIRKNGGPPPVSQLWRALWHDRVLSITNVFPNDAKDGWILLCSEGERDA